MFEISDAARGRHPGLVVGWLRMDGLAPRAESPELERGREAVEEDLRRRFGAAPKGSILAEEPSRSYQEHYARHKKTYPVALQAESVAAKGRPIAGPDPLVRAMFMAELKNMLLTAGHDFDAIRGRPRLGLSSGAEPYSLLGGVEKAPPEGDVTMSDEEGIIASVILGPDGRTSIVRGTERALFVVYAPASVGTAPVLAHLRDIAAFASLCCPRARAEEPGAVAL